MTEDEARSWLGERFGAEVCDRIALFLDMVVAENDHQNLVSPTSIPAIWSRHALDSAQLLALAPEHWRSWIDVGTGGGFPGVVVALLKPDRAVTLVEPRRKRAAFLQHCIDTFRLSQASVVASKIESVTEKADVISARAVASVVGLVRSAEQCAHDTTTWLLPRGRSGKAELDVLPPANRNMFHVEHSLTDPQSGILVGRGRA